MVGVVGTVVLVAAAIGVAAGDVVPEFMAAAPTLADALPPVRRALASADKGGSTPFGSSRGRRTGEAAAPDGGRPGSVWAARGCERL